MIQEPVAAVLEFVGILALGWILFHGACLGVKTIVLNVTEEKFAHVHEDIQRIESNYEDVLRYRTGGFNSGNIKAITIPKCTKPPQPGFCKE